MLLLKEAFPRELLKPRAGWRQQILIHLFLYNAVITFRSSANLVSCSTVTGRGKSRISSYDVTYHSLTLSKEKEDNTFTLVLKAAVSLIVALRQQKPQEQQQID